MVGCVIGRLILILSSFNISIKRPSDLEPAIFGETKCQVMQTKVHNGKTWMLVEVSEEKQGQTQHVTFL